MQKVKCLSDPLAPGQSRGIRLVENIKKVRNPFELQKVKGFERKVLETHVLDLLVPVRVALFYAEGVYGSVSGVNYPELPAGFHNSSVHSHKRFVGNVKLPSKFTNETHSKCKSLIKDNKY